MQEATDVNGVWENLCHRVICLLGLTCCFCSYNFSPKYCTCRALHVKSVEQLVLTISFVVGGTARVEKKLRFVLASKLDTIVTCRQGQI